MKKLGLLLFLFVCAAVVRAQSNIVKSLERNVPGQGKVTIHQDSRIEALLGTARTGTGEQTVIIHLLQPVIPYRSPAEYR